MSGVWEWIKNVLAAIYKWFRQDGLLHFALSALLMVALGWIRPLWIPALIAFAVGMGKEITDAVSGADTAKLHDVFCDVLGVGVGCLLVWFNILAN